jgi:hypothetical protein
VLDDRRDLFIVHPALDHADQRGRQVHGFQRGQRLLADARQPRAAQIEQGFVIQCVELEIDFQRRGITGQTRDELPVLRDADAVCVDHHVADRAALHRVEYREEFGVDGRLPARKLHQVGFAFARHQGIEHGLDLGQRRWLPWTSAASAKHTGQERLQALLISMIARQECCS